MTTCVASIPLSSPMAPLQVVALGFVRPELRFPGGLGELIARIKADVATARIQLDAPELGAAASDPFLS